MYDDLYEERIGRKAWSDGVSAECREWLEGLADHILEHGEPVWRQVHRRVKDLFPDDAPNSDSTVRDTVRRLVTERG